MDGQRIRVSGRFAHGLPLDYTVCLEIELPLNVADDDDELYLVATPTHVGEIQVRPDDALLIEPRSLGRASTSELVLVEHDGRAYVGRWWDKRGQVSVFDEKSAWVVSGCDVRLIGVVILIVLREAPR